MQKYPIGISSLDKTLKDGLSSPLSPREKGMHNVAFYGSKLMNISAFIP